MGLFKFKQSQASKEKKAYKQILNKKLTTARRKAYAEEAEKVAIERAKEKARRPTFGEQFRARARSSIEKRISGKRSPVKRRTITRRSPVKRRTITRRSPVRRKTVARRSPVRRKTVARRVTTQESRPPQNLNDAIYGG